MNIATFYDGQDFSIASAIATSRLEGNVTTRMVELLPDFMWCMVICQDGREYVLTEEAFEECKGPFRKLFHGA